jgi:SnoaL-like polyketide cyclase
VKPKHEALLDQFQIALVGRDRARLHEACAPDLHYEDPLCAQPLTGPDELADHVAHLWQAFPDARVERLGERLGDGQYIAAPIKLVGTHTGDLGSIPASGRSLAVHAVLICELDPPGERLWRVRPFFDVYGAAVQIGVLPERGTLGERALMMVRGFGLRVRR